jgi:hypothetical protein
VGEFHIARLHVGALILDQPWRGTGVAGVTLA